MSIIKYVESDTTYAIVTGRIYSLKFRETQSNKTYATFSVAYDYRRDEFDKPTNVYMNCIAWSTLAEFIGELQERQDKPSVMVCGKIKASEYKGESREQLEVDYVQLQATTTATEEKKSKRKKPEDDFEDINF